MGLKPRQAGRLHLWLGLAQLKMGDLYRAERELAQAARLGEAGAFYRLGQVCRLLRRPAAAEVEFLRQAATRYAALKQPRSAARCYAQAAWSLMVEGKVAEAVPELAAAAGGGWHSLIAQALFLSLTGQREEAERLCLEMLDHPPLPSWLRAEIGWLLGCSSLEAGDLTAAQLHAAIAYSFSLVAWNPPQIERILQLRRRLPAGGGESRRSSARV